VFVPRHVVRVLGVAMSPESPRQVKARLLSLLNCDRIVLPPDPKEIFTLGRLGPTRLVRLPKPLPRVYVVGGAEVLETQDAVLRRLSFGPWEPGKTALVDHRSVRDSRFAGLEAGEVEHIVRRVEYGRNTLNIDVQSDSSGILVVGDSYYPGWVATVNGLAAPVCRVNYAFRGVRIPIGASTVLMTYRPNSVRIGIAISVTTLVVLVVLAIPTRRRRWRSEDVQAQGRRQKASPVQPRQHE
jgi:hypothetical protein